MNSRINLTQQSPVLMKKLIELGQTSHDSPLERKLLDLINIRVSQINGCSFCLDMHSKEAKIHGERELRLYHLPVWRESTLFSDKERAALTWAEAVTTTRGHAISDEVFQSVRKHLSEKELSDLTFSVGIINFFNMLNIADPKPPGSLDTMMGLDKAGLK